MIPEPEETITEDITENTSSEISATEIADISEENVEQITQDVLADDVAEEALAADGNV